jgi:hypothetical protein
VISPLARLACRPYFEAMIRQGALTFSVGLPGGDRRFWEAILFVAAECQRARRFGKVKLNKILWRADFQSFKARMVPVTGWSYEKRAAGPAPVQMEASLNSMVEEGLIAINKIDVGGDYVEHRVVPLREARMDFFDSVDMEYINESIQFYWRKSATNASELSHATAWNVCNFTEVMPYESVFLSDKKLNLDEKERLHALARARGWKSL